MILGFLLTAAYWPGIAGAATTPRWALLAVALPIVLLFKREDSCAASQDHAGIRADCGLSRSSSFTLIHLFGALFLTWSAISLIWTPNWLDGANELIKLVILVQAFVFGSRLESLRPILIGMALGLILSSIMVLIQLGWPDIVLHTTTHSGLFINSGSLGEIAALVLIGLVYLNISGPRFYPILTIGILPCVILPQSRGSWLALIAAFTFWLWSKSKLSALVLMALAAISFTYSLHINFHISSVIQRWGMWTDAMAGMTWLGHGIGSTWTAYAPLSNTLDIFKERPDHLHNDWLEVGFEGGIVGVIALCGLAYSVLRARNSGISLCVLVGFAAEAFVGFPFHVPCTAFLAALCLGHLVRGGPSLLELVHNSRIFLHLRRDRQRSSAHDHGHAEGSLGLSA